VQPPVPGRPSRSLTALVVAMLALAVAAGDAAAVVGPPPLTHRFIEFGSKRKSEMAAYARRHYGLNTYKLVRPHVIVEHYTATTTFSAAYNTFAIDAPDSELHELPGTCSHFIVDRDGTIYQLVHLGIMCRHTVGLNYTAFGIEHVGMSDGDVMGDRKQLQASLRLTRWLRCRYGIAVKNVIGHNESLGSRYHHENVARLRNQTHGDMRHATMNRYRSRLSRLACG
jgi:N-acetylmuramoyl-L-alanine amidase